MLEANEMLVRCYEQGALSLPDQVLPGHGTRLFGALRDRAKQRNDGVGNPTQDRHDEHGARIVAYPRGVVFFERDVQREPTRPGPARACPRG